MRITAALPESTIRQGFTTDGDIFGRKDLADRLTAMFLSIDHGTVCLLDGAWGSGKTVFARQWVAELERQRIPAIYFDAFASDYMESPFTALAGVFVKAALDAGKKDDPTYKELLKRAAIVGRAVASTAAKIGVKFATLGLVGAAEVEELNSLGDGVADALSDLTEKQVEKLLENHAKAQGNFDALRDSLQHLPKLLAPDRAKDGESSPKLIVIIDELDRCRPDFAMGILETLKHFFRADGVHFVLVTNKSHLELAVANRYGIGEQARDYLEKFFDFVVFFETEYGQGIDRFVDQALAQLLPPEAPGARDVINYIKLCARAYRLSLRQISSLSTNIAISFLAVRKGEFRPAVLVSFLCLLKILRPDLYRLACQGQLRPGPFEEVIDEGNWGDTDTGQIKLLFEFYLSREVDADDERFSGYASQLWSFNVSREDAIPFLTNSIMDRFGASAATDG